MPFISTPTATFNTATRSYSFTVPEDAGPGTVIGRVGYSAPGMDGEPMFMLFGPDRGRFEIRPDGSIVVNAGTAFDFESGAREFSLVIEAAYTGADGDFQT